MDLCDWHGALYPAPTGRPAGPTSSAGHNLSVLSLLCFAGGWGSSVGPHPAAVASVQRVWPIILRTQILVTSATLSLVAAWAPHLGRGEESIGPRWSLAGGMWIPLCGLAADTGNELGRSEAAFEGWAAAPNSGFWVVPAAHCLRRSRRHHGRRPGQRGQLGLGRRVRAPACAEMRRSPSGAPPPGSTSRRSLASVIEAPCSIWPAMRRLPPREVLTLAGPLLAFSGAALFAGSVLHPHNVATVRTPHTFRRLSHLALGRARVLYFVLVAACSPTRPPSPSSPALSGLGAPSFQPIPAGGPVWLSLRRGHRRDVRWGWVGAPHRPRTGLTLVR